MALIYKVETQERVTLTVSAEGFGYYMWLQMGKASEDHTERCRQLERFLHSLGMRYVVLSWEVNEEG